MEIVAAFLLVAGVLGFVFGLSLTAVADLEEGSKLPGIFCITASVVAFLIGAALLVSLIQADNQACADRGGKMVHGTCIDRSVFK